jgi:predicted peroxiredoxin
MIVCMGRDYQFSTKLHTPILMVGVHPQYRQQGNAGHPFTRMKTMSENKQQLVIIASHGMEDERATVAWTLANGGLASGLDVTVFLVSSAVDLVRKGAVDFARMNPLDPPLKELIEDFAAKGGKIWACPPCAKVRGYSDQELIDGVVITGSGSLHGLIKEGAATLSV